ncbi:hypothetical protein KIH86_03535 [Paenibacillus sp. HN-1]|uniref:hypothetical protein n=1 Tax=Paenibacillus TaxID=44249 RepID=UPI001CA9699D|nr:MULTISPECIES: hypothetical protein [Paenibacillus]MBY9077254.1 hypothetical protein [Paenibacillus sp. CGMCC 1.18879]MBY9083301.1 hypothetical protein [Paenibacillus sinensis]
MRNKQGTLQHQLVQRWYDLDERLTEVGLFIAELDELASEGFSGSVFNTAIYRVLDKEHRTIQEEQKFIEGLGIPELARVDKNNQE